MLVIENISTGGQQQVNQAQWEQIQKIFPKSFKVIHNLENYSDAAKEIIAKAEEE